MGTALGGNQGVDLVDDDGVDGAQGFGGLRSQHQVERLGVVIRMSAGWRRKRARSRWGVSPVRTLIERLVEGDAPAAGHVGDAGERRTQIALDVDGQGFEGRDVDDPCSHLSFRRQSCPAALALSYVLRTWMEHQPVEAPEEGGEGFAGSGGGEDQGAFAASDDRPAQRCGAVGASNTAGTTQP